MTDATNRATQVVPPPSELPTLSSPSSLSPILVRLLECPASALSLLSTQMITSLKELPEEDRPTLYEGLLDVARFCVEEEPGWSTEQRAMLIGGHPRIGRPSKAVSAVSAMEQTVGSSSQGAGDDEATFQRLARLNFLYEQRFPSLRFVTYVAGRPRNVVADELETLLGPSISKLSPPQDVLDSHSAGPSSSTAAPQWSGFPQQEIKPPSSTEWQAELTRAEAALWEIASDRATKLEKEVASGAKVTVEMPSEQAEPASTTTAVASSSSSSDPASAFDVPFLSEATFRALVLASPILHTFFETDLPASFHLQPPQKVPASTKDALLSAFNDVSLQGTRGVTRERVRGLLGGLLGDVADAVGGRVGGQTVSGPKPSFARSTAAGISLEEAARQGGGRLAPVSPAALSAKRSMQGMQQQAMSMSSDSKGDEERRAHDAADEVRRAHEALERSRHDAEKQQFVIDAPGEESTADDTVDDIDDEAEDLLGQEQQEKGKLTGKEAQLAKDLRTAEAQ